MSEDLLAPIEWLVDDLCTTIMDASPEELPDLHNKLTALAEAIQVRSPKTPNGKERICSEDDLKVFQEEVTTLINKLSLENASNTPDYVLAAYLRRCLENFNETNSDREISKL